MCVSAVLRVSNPDSTCGGGSVVKTGIQLGRHDLILQEGPVKKGRAEPDQTNRCGQTEERGEEGGERCQVGG